MKRRLATRLVLPVVLLAVLCGCASPGTDLPSMVLTTTTSVQDSGILDAFVESFEELHPFAVKAVAVGSGSALFMGSNGDADIMITHEPRAEKTFMEAGYGESHWKLMYNDFILVGPESDPAGLKGVESGVEAFRELASGGHTFLSRGDASGTHAMEMLLWESNGISPEGPWYLEAGQGMGETLRMAEEYQAYVLTDRASYIVMRHGLALVPLVEGGPILLNQYTVTVVNHEMFPRTNHEGALAFEEFPRLPSTKELIEDFGMAEYGVRLFRPGEP